MSHNVPAGKTTDVSHNIELFIVVHYCHLSPCKGDETHIFASVRSSIGPTSIRAVALSEPVVEP